MRLKQSCSPHDFLCPSESWFSLLLLSKKRARNSFIFVFCLLEARQCWRSSGEVIVEKVQLITSFSPYETLLCLWERGRGGGQCVHGKMGKCKLEVEEASVVCLYPVVLGTKEEKAVRWREIIWLTSLSVWLPESQQPPWPVLAFKQIKKKYSDLLIN